MNCIWDHGYGDDVDDDDGSDVDDNDDEDDDDDDDDGDDDGDDNDDDDDDIPGGKSEAGGSIIPNSTALPASGRMPSRKGCQWWWRQWRWRLDSDWLEEVPMMMTWPQWLQ